MSSQLKCTLKRKFITLPSRLKSVRELHSIIHSQLFLDEGIAALQKEIGELKELLEKEKLIRKNKDIYDSIAKEILKLPSVEALTQSCLESEGELAALAAQQASIQEQIELNANSAFDAIDTLKDLKAKIESDIKSNK